MSDRLTTTLAAIRAASPCREGWAKLKKHVGNLADDAPLAVAVVLESNGLDDSLWVLTRACGERGRDLAALFTRECVLRACERAERVLPVFEAARQSDDRPRRAIEAVRAGTAYAAAAAAAAADDAADAADDAAYAAAAAYTAYAAAYAADAAAYADAYADAAAAYTDAREREREWQVARLREMLEGGR